MGKTTDLSAFERGLLVGARGTCLRVARTAPLLGFSQSTVSSVDEEWSTKQKTSNQLDTPVGSIVKSTWASFPVERFLHLVVHAPDEPRLF
jgi:hypothetical protein